MRAPLTILAIALAGAAALWLARDLAVWAQRGRTPLAAAAPALSPAASAAPSLGDAGAAPLRVPALAPQAPIDAGDAGDAGAVGDAGGAPERALLGFEDGGEPTAARPRGDFQARYEGWTKSARAQALSNLEARLSEFERALTPAQRDELGARLTGRSPPSKSAAVDMALALRDERDWLVDTLRTAPAESAESAESPESGESGESGESAESVGTGKAAGDDTP